MAIKRLCAGAFVLLQLVCSQLLTDALPVDSLQPQHNRRGRSQPPGLEALRQQERSRRRVGDVDASGPTEYMQQLYSTLADSDGRPRNVTYDPTDILCILDKGESLVDLQGRLSRAIQVGGPALTCAYN